MANWPVSQSVKPSVATCIVMSNRMFAGYKCEGHPVRGNIELLNQLTVGKIVLIEREYKTWKAQDFSEDDLWRFLKDDITYQPVWSSVASHKRSYNFQAQEVIFESYAFDMEMLSKNIQLEECSD